MMRLPLRGVIVEAVISPVLLRSTECAFTGFEARNPVIRKQIPPAPPPLYSKEKLEAAASADVAILEYVALLSSLSSAEDLSRSVHPEGVVPPSFTNV